MLTLNANTENLHDHYKFISDKVQILVHFRMYESYLISYIAMSIW